MGNRTDAMTGMGLAISFVVLVEIVWLRNKATWITHTSRPRDWLVGTIRMLLVFATALAGWLWYLLVRSSRGHCMHRVARWKTWEIVSVRTCRDSLTVAKLWSNNRVLLVLGFDLALTAAVVVDAMTVIFMARWWRFHHSQQRLQRHALVLTAPALAAVTYSSSMEHSPPGTMPLATWDASDPNPIIRWSSISVDSGATLDLARDSVQGLDSILEAMDESNEASIFQTSFASSNSE